MGLLIFIDRLYSRRFNRLKLPCVSILILNYNGLRWLPICLSSAAKTDYPNLKIYLVDNGSTDGSVDYVRKNFPWIKVILNKKNLGFAEGFNRAIKQVDADYIALLNTDTEVLNPNWIRHLIDVALSDPKIAAVACKMVSMEDHSRLDSVGGMGIPFWRGFVDIGKAELDQGQYDHESFEPFAFCGGAVLIKWDIFIKSGGFDEKFFLFLEDGDLSWRLRLFGYRVAFSSNAKVAHYYSGSFKSKATDARKLYLCHRNLLRAILKNCGSSLGWALRNYFLYSIIMAAGFSIIEPKKAVVIVKAIFWNLTNFKSTYIRRLKIQSNRRKDDMEILDKMYPKLKRYQTAERVKLRRILDILFQ